MRTNNNMATVSSLLTGLDYCCVTLIILFNINHLLAHSVVVTSITIKYYYYISLTIQLNSYSFTHS